MLTRTRTIHLYRAEMPLPILSEWICHENSETTLIYAYAYTEMKHEAIQKTTGSSNTLNKNNKIQPFQKNDDEMVSYLYGLLELIAWRGRYATIAAYVFKLIMTI